MYAITISHRIELSRALENQSRMVEFTTTRQKNQAIRFLMRLSYLSCLRAYIVGTLDISAGRTTSRGKSYFPLPWALERSRFITLSWIRLIQLEAHHSRRCPSGFCNHGNSFLSYVQTIAVYTLNHLHVATRSMSEFYVYSPWSVNVIGENDNKMTTC